MPDLERLFHCCSPQLDSLSIYITHVASEAVSDLPFKSRCSTIKTLRLPRMHRWDDLKWLSDSRLPFNFSRLCHAEIQLLKPTVAQVLQKARSSIRYLKLDPYDFDNPISAGENGMNISQFTEITTLVIDSGHELHDVETLLSQLNKDNRIDVLIIEIRKIRRLDEHSLKHLGASVGSTPLPVLRKLEVFVCRFRPGGESVLEIQSMVRLAFAEPHIRGLLKFRVS
ncbi:hypothetical protein B0H10DRAFT_208030 [Mycena sp. CBHHK59/15]|nr:hypothetical protein B0H10DRAFT_208030 [Mycena sp. CBHHK59/15]